MPIKRLSQYSLDPSSKVPLYFQLEEILRGLITSGEFQPGQLLPSEAELQRLFNVSRITVRQSLGNLERDGLILRRRAKGTRVAEPKIESDLEHIRSFTQELQAQGFDPTTQEFHINLVPCEETVSEILKCGVGDEVYQLCRLRGSSERPLGVFETHLPRSLNLQLEDDYSGSMYKLLEEKYGTNIAFIDEYLEATTASRELAAQLKIDTGDPILKQVRVGYDAGQRPIEYTVVHFRGDLYRYRYKHPREK